jgi:hypothetical protein
VDEEPNHTTARKLGLVKGFSHANGSVRSERVIQRERQQGALPGPLSWSAQCYMAGEGGFGYVTVAVSWQGN